MRYKFERQRQRGAMVRMRALATRLAVAVSLALAASLGSSLPAASLTGAVSAGRGPVTNLPLPRYVSLKAAEGNARRGPSTAQRIDWVFTRRGMPLQIIAEYENWRQVRDRDGATGWMHYTLLSGTRTVLIEQDLVPIRDAPEDGSAEVARLQAGVIARLLECRPEWCRISVDGYRGWLRKAAVWGVDPEEARD